MKTSTDKIVFLTTTMFSRKNGPANFAMNLWDFKNNEILFITEDGIIDESVKVIEVNWSQFFFPISMIIKGIEYYRNLRKVDYNIAVWNFSVLAWFTLRMNNSKKKHVVFVNDSLSLDNTYRLNYASIRYSFFRYFEKFSCRRADRVITNSPSIKDKIIQSYNISPYKIHVLIKGINFNEILLCKTDFEIDFKNPIQISFVKSNHIIGGLELLVKALDKLNDHHFILDIYGPQRIESHFYKYPTIQIKLNKKLGKSELMSELIKSDLFCTPCSKEAFGQANIEALALQIPTVILPIESQRNLHHDNYCWFSENLEIEALGLKILEVIYSPKDLREKKSILGREIVLKKFNIQNTFKDFDQFVQF